MNEVTRQLFDQGLGDAKVHSISWTDEDLFVEFILPSDEKQPPVLRLCFIWVTHVRIDLDYGEYVGQPLLFSATAQKTATGTWSITLEFGAAPEGTISFECNEITTIDV